MKARQVLCKGVSNKSNRWTCLKRFRGNFCRSGALPAFVRNYRCSARKSEDVLGFRAEVTPLQSIADMLERVKRARMAAAPLPPETNHHR